MAELIDRLQATLGDGYRIKSELGGGGMSRVFVAEEVDLGRPVVIKVLPPDLAAGLNVDRFRREIQMAARLQHPHIVPVLSAGAKDGLLYYTMPLIQGESLRARLSRAGELPVNEASRILREVADALEYAHSSGIVHRDIKPENVLLSGNHALVMDFGVAKALSEATGQTNLTSVGVALGTPTYMSPEQATADPMTDHRSDIYSLGVMGYELLAGRPPFTGTTPQQVLAAQVTESPAEITKHRAAIPPMLATVIMKCLQKKPADRYQTAEEVRQQLEVVGTPTGGLTPHATVPLQAVRASGFDRKRAGIIGAGVALVLLFALVAGKYLGGASAAYEMTDAAQVTNESGTAITPGLSPDGKLLAYAGGNPIEPVVYVRQLSGGQPIRIAPGIDPRFSPDASKIIFVNQDGIAEAPALGGSVRTIVRHKGWNNLILSPAYSHDGKRIAYADRTGIIVANSDGSDPRDLVKAYDPHSLAWSPDDSRIAFVSGNAWFIYGQSQFANLSPSLIKIASVKERETNAITDSTHLNVSPAWAPDGTGIFFASSVRGGKDIYFQAVKGLQARGEPQRLTTGLNIHGISAATDGTVAYSVVNTRVGIWSIPIPASGTASLREARQITSGSERIESISMSHDGKWIAFDSDRSGNSDIYKIHPDGSGLEQLTRDVADDFRPRWSADDKVLSFHTWRGGTRDIYTMNSDGSDQRLFVGGPQHEWADAWSPDGKWMAYMSDRLVRGRQDLFVMPAGGGAAKHVGIGGATGWTPDGRYVAWGSGGLAGGVMLTEISTGKTVAIFNPSDKAGFASETGGWSRDGKYLYVRMINGPEVNITRIARDGSEAKTVVRFDDPNRTSYKPDFTLDDRNFYFTIGKHEADIWRVHVARK
jgi:Tol biopolymer transport system component